MVKVIAFFILFFLLLSFLYYTRVSSINNPYSYFPFLSIKMLKKKAMVKNMAPPKQGVRKGFVPAEHPTVQDVFSE